MKTKGDLLRFSIAFALSSVCTGRNRLGLSEEARYQVADDAIKELRRYGQWRELDDSLPELATPLTVHGKDQRHKDWR